MKNKKNSISGKRGSWWCHTVRDTLRDTAYEFTGETEMAYFKNAREFTKTSLMEYDKGNDSVIGDDTKI